VWFHRLRAMSMKINFFSQSSVRARAVVIAVEPRSTFIRTLGKRLEHATHRNPALARVATTHLDPERHPRQE
jgi:hypothetical protein